MQLTERTANVPDVLNELSKVNIQQPVLIDSYHLEITDSSLTRGASFWKGSRKIMVLERGALDLYNALKSDTKAARGAKPKKRNIDLVELDEDYEEEDDDDDDDDDISYSPLANTPPLASSSISSDSYASLNDKLVQISSVLVKMESSISHMTKPVQSDSLLNEKYEKLLHVVNAINSHFNCIICLDLVKGNIN